MCPVYAGKLWDVTLQTRNCVAVLQYLRLKDRLRTLWVDTICVNQSSTAEKSTQVPRMDVIFNKTMRVVAFLEAVPRTKGFPVGQEFNRIPATVLDVLGCQIEQIVCSGFSKYIKAL